MKLSEKRTLKKKEQILLTAITVVNQRGYDGATMEEIAAELLMTKGSLYYYFANKGDLMYQCHNFVLSHAAKDLEAELNEEGTAEDVLRRMLATHIDYVIDEKETNNLMIRPRTYFNEDQVESVLALRKYYSSLFDRVIDQGIASGEFHVQDPFIARMMILGATNWLQQWYRPDGRISKAELKQSFGDHILKLLK